MKSSLFYFAAGIAAAVAKPLSPGSSPTHFFTFGNSYTTTGFDIHGNQPSAANPMGNPAIGSSTSSGGNNWVGYLTTKFNESLVLTYDLAVGGATIDNKLVESHVKELVHQVSDFESVYGKGSWKSNNTVFGFWIGINDIGHAYQDKNATEFVPKLISRYESLVENIYKDGGRQFLFVDVPAVSRSPKIISQGQTEKHEAWVHAFNKALETMVKKFQNKHKDVKTVVYDSWSFMSKVLDDPKAHGFEDNKCTDKGGVTCVWFNDYHPGLKYHQLQTKDMKQHLKSFGAW